MGTLTPQDFEGLTVPQYKEKLSQVSDLVLLKTLEAIEGGQEAPRKGVLSAINERQGELIGDQPEVIDASTEEGFQRLHEVLESGDELEIKETHLNPEEIVKIFEDASATTSVDTQVLLTEEVEEVEEVDEADVSSEDVAEVESLVKTLRLEVDEILQSCESHVGIDASPEEALFLAKCWLGKLLTNISENPYDVEVKTVKDIPATAERNEGVDFQVRMRQFGNKNTLPAVLELRERLEVVAKELESLEINLGREFAICRANAWTKVREAKFQLGKTLSRLKA